MFDVLKAADYPPVLKSFHLHVLTEHSRLSPLVASSAAGVPKAQRRLLRRLRSKCPQSTDIVLELPEAKVGWKDSYVST